MFPFSAEGLVSWRRHVRWVALAGLIGIFGGCGPSGPKTYPVKGKVVTAKPEDLKRLVGKGIELQSTTEPETRGFGTIQPDGSFTISTLRPGATASLPGAIEGTHKARLQINMADDEDGQPRRAKFAVDRKYTHFDKSGWEVKVPSNEEVVLTVR